MNAQQEVVLSPRRVNLDDWPTWAKSNLKPSDVLVVEATTNTWWFYDQTHESVGQVLVADPRKIAWIAQKVKTDAHDVSWKLTPEQRGGLTTRQFVRYQLLQLGLGHDLMHVLRGGKYLIAPPDEVLQLKPELQNVV